MLKAMLKASLIREVRPLATFLARKEQFLSFQRKRQIPTRFEREKLSLNCHNHPAMIPYRIATWGHE